LGVDTFEVSTSIIWCLLDLVAHKIERIIFYIDGMDKGQFDQVLLYEMDVIR